jgi:hypothetical protein
LPLSTAPSRPDPKHDTHPPRPDPPALPHRHRPQVHRSGPRRDALPRWRGRAGGLATGGGGGSHHPPKAKSVIWIFLCGGVSHLECWDPKPALIKYAGKSIADTPFADAVKSEKKEVVEGNPNHGNRKTLMALNCGTARYGKSGLLAADWWRHTAEMADGLTLQRGFR